MASILDESIVDGPGIRVAVFFQGCRRFCPGCHNPALLPFEGGTPYDVEELARIVLGKLTGIHRGVTFSGGDPLYQADGVAVLIDCLRRIKPAINIWLYTGFEYEQVSDWPAVCGVDVLVDGPFVQTQRDLMLRFRGSLNQRIIDVRTSQTNGQVIEYKLQG